MRWRSTLSASFWHLPFALPIDADGDEHSLMDNSAAIRHPFLARIKNQMGIELFQLPVAKPRQCPVQPIVNGAGRKTVTAQFLGDGLDLADGDKLHLPRRQCRDQRLLVARAALNEPGGELAAAIPQDLQFELADPGDQISAVIAQPIPASGLGEFPPVPLPETRSFHLRILPAALPSSAPSSGRGRPRPLPPQTTSDYAHSWSWLPSQGVKRSDLAINILS